MREVRIGLTAVVCCLILSACGGGSGSDTTGSTATANITPIQSTREQLGRMLFFDASLSSPEGQACADCHDPAAGFSDPNHEDISPGAVSGLAGNRNAPTAAYAAFSPSFHEDRTDPTKPYWGGQFLDGRAADLIEQAKGPFLNPLEMANLDKASVVNKVKNGPFAGEFLYVFPDAYSDVETDYQHIAEAIAAFEQTDEVSPFSSKYDYYLKGQASLSAQELRGMQQFQLALCSNCHSFDPLDAAKPQLFTDYSYANLGVPKNPDNPFYTQPSNPDGVNYIDRGLGGVLSDVNEVGKFKTPTLRNVDLTAPYMHNGVFDTLEQVVNFYNERDLAPQDRISTDTWGPPEESRNINTTEMGDIGLNAQDVADIVAFMKTLSDGYVP